MNRLIMIVLGLVALGIIGAAFTYWRAHTIPAPEGVGNGDLAPCPDTPNCVSSQATDNEHGVDPLSYTGSVADAREQLLAVLNGMPRSEIVTQTDTYIHAVFRSATMGFPDDTEFVFDTDANVIHVRSAARMGAGDMGVNRNRVQAIRDQFQKS